MRVLRAGGLRGRGAPASALGVALLLAALSTSPAARAAPPAPPAPPATVYPEYQASASCRLCHERIFDQHEGSAHARAFSDPPFRAQYLAELLPAAAGDERLVKEAERCVACHNPIAYAKARGRPGLLREYDPALSGVICDLCHRIGAYKGAGPESGNFMSSPGDKKFGPFKHPQSEWHHVFHEMQTSSAFCGICHEDVNGAGVRVKATYSEWRASEYAQRGIQCQDCHMSAQGYLVDERPVFESGRAAAMTVGRSEDRAALFSHRFPGMSSAAQGEVAALTVTPGEAPAAPGAEVEVRVVVANRKAGHSLPTGSADLRLVWLELTAESGGESVPVAAAPGAASACDVAGGCAADRDLLGAEIPAGSRVYRAVYVDGAGAQTLASYRAAGIAFDNRIKAREERAETYRLRVPAGARDRVLLKARLLYLAYPAAFARSLAIAPAAPVTLAEAVAALAVAPAPAAPAPH
jgi:hypothetical protein